MWVRAGPEGAECVRSVEVAVHRGSCRRPLFSKKANPVLGEREEDGRIARGVACLSSR